MKMVLVAGFNPRLQKNGPKVMLAAGKYKLCVENHKDSELVLHIELDKDNRTYVIQPDEIFEIQSKQTVRLSLLNGTEDYINAFAESINEPVPSSPS